MLQNVVHYKPQFTIDELLFSEMVRNRSYPWVALINEFYRIIFHMLGKFILRKIISNALNTRNTVTVDFQADAHFGI